MKNVLRIVIVAALVLGFGLSVMGQQKAIQFGSIKGQVVDEAQKAMAGVIVEYRYTDKGTTKKAVKTDSKGNFVIHDIVTNQVVYLSVSADGYAEKNNIKTIASTDSHSPIIIELEPFSAVNALIGLPVTKEFKIEHGDAEEIFLLIQPYVLQNGGSSVSRRYNTIVATTFDNKMRAVEEIIAKYDVPPKQVWVEVQLIKANGHKADALPEDVKPIVDKLRKLFNYKSYSIIGRAEGMGVDGSNLQFGISRDRMAEAAFGVKTGVNLSGNIVQLKDLKIQVSAPISNTLSTSVNVKNGETLILGASRENDDSGALITVVRARIVE